MDRNHKIRRRARNIKINSDRPRLAVFRSAKHIYGQIIDDKRGVTLAAVSTLKFKEEKTTGLEKAKIAGKTLAEVAEANKITAVSFDRRSYRYHGRVKAFAEALREGGLKF